MHDLNITIVTTNYNYTKITQNNEKSTTIPCYVSTTSSNIEKSTTIQCYVSTTSSNNEKFTTIQCYVLTTSSNHTMSCMSLDITIRDNSYFSQSLIIKNVEAQRVNAARLNGLNDIYKLLIANSNLFSKY